MSELKFPTQVVSLPSNGWFYAEENPLSSGQIELKYPTAKDEDILTDVNLIKKGAAFDMFLKNIIVNKNISLDDMIVGDVNGITIASRILAYGPNYDFTAKCPSCKKETRQSIDLQSLTSNKIDFDRYKKGTTVFDFVLPHSEVPVKFQLVTNRLEKEIKQEIAMFEKSMKRRNDMTARLSKILVSVDGNSDPLEIKKFVNGDNFLTADSLALRQELEKISPGIDLTFDFSCEFCSYSLRRNMPMGIHFFWPGLNL